MARMSITEIIRDTRPVLRFSDQAVSREAIIDLLNDAVWAPTPNSGSSEPWRFILASDGAKKKLVEIMVEVGEELKRSNVENARVKEQFIQTAINTPIYLIVVMKENPKQEQWEDDFATICCMIQNFHLLGWEKGIGMTWLTDDELYESPQFREHAGIRTGEKAVSMLNIGYYEEIPRSKARMPVENRLTIL
ncbi:nitroreductase [Paenibacillus sp. MER TA 81-3]|nr:nitroreductase [Paenibacillus sp. MER TA 81-3]